MPNTVVPKKSDPEAAARAERLERENLQLARAVAAQAAKLEEKARRIKTLEKLALSVGDADAIAELKRRRRRTTGNVLRDEREKPPRASLDAVGALCRRAEAAEAALKQNASDGAVPASPIRFTESHSPTPKRRRGAREDDRGRAGARGARRGGARGRRRPRTGARPPRRRARRGPRPTRPSARGAPTAPRRRSRRRAAPRPTRPRPRRRWPTTRRASRSASPRSWTARATLAPMGWSRAR